MRRDLDEPLPGTAHRRLAGGDDDQLIREEPLLIDVAGRTVLTMRTPGADRELAVGFLLSEGVAAAVTDIGGCRLVAADPAAGQPDGVVVHVTGSVDRMRARLTRAHEIRSSCGVCGLADPDALLDDLPPLMPGVPRLPRDRVEGLRRALEARQPLFARTGGCHAAALLGVDGEVWASAEDVGRHNALDKVIGAAALAGRDLGQAVAMLSGRAGFDLVLKCLRLRIPIVLSVSAPSAQSFDLCQAAGATLIGFVRPDRMKVYCDGGRLA